METAQADNAGANGGGDPAANAASADAHRLRAMELWGGNGAARDRLSVPGFDAYVYCQPHRGDHAGGDVRFVSTCAAGQIVRFTLADISGHGQAVSDAAVRLRSLMRKHINTPNPTKFTRRLNREFVALSRAGRFATAVITTYFTPTDQLTVCNAGHPRPLFYRVKDRAWSLLDESTPGVTVLGSVRADRITNLPLGVIAPTHYPQFETRLEPGDVLLSYTDALIEAQSPGGVELGEAGLLGLVQGLGERAHWGLGPAVLEAVAAHRGGHPADDDATLLVLHHNGSNPPPIPFHMRMRALGHLVGLVR